MLVLLEFKYDCMCCNCNCIFDAYFLAVLFQEDKSRVELFSEYARKSKELVYGPFLNMLNRPDTFTVNQVRHTNCCCIGT